MKPTALLAILVLAVLFSFSMASAEEGMWTLDNFPAEAVEAAYGVKIDDAWLDQVRLSTTRLEGGCTGSFVSPDGLILTNHHCLRGCAAQLSSAERDLEEDGFLAAEMKDELRCESEQISILMEMQDVTAQVADAITGLDEQKALDARRKTLTRLEQECENTSRLGDNSDLSCESVSLYSGGQYFLYKYKRYEDVRLVFAPEAGIAAFGGDPDNFNFPRWCLDMGFLRAYENDKPIKSPNYLRMRPEGAAPGEPVFVSGHPGSTERQLTAADLRFRRDITLPTSLLRSSELRGRFIQYGQTSEEALRTVQTPLMYLENGITVRRNELFALMDDQLFARKVKAEQSMREELAADPDLRRQAGKAWDEIQRALDTYETFRDPYIFLEGGVAFNGTLAAYARRLVRGAHERALPNEDRQRGYTEAALPGMRQRLLAPRPVYPGLEETRLAFSLDKLREWLGPDHPLVHAVLGDDSPEGLARKLVSGTKLADPEVRLALWEGGAEAIAASEDPFIVLARTLDPQARALRDRYDAEVEAPMDLAYERIARASFDLYGTDTYPDATFTLRVTYGAVNGWTEKGAQVDPYTVLSRLYERTTGRDPFRLPDSWLAAKSKLDPTTRFNFVATTDITGGNSGSPVVDAKGRLVGLAFDGNIHSIAGSYWFDEQKNRTVSVHPAIMLEALQKVYSADRLIKELNVR